jgi:type VI secretion system FHA domain protein
MGAPVALQLRVVSEHRRALGDRSCVVFDRAGGRIGRSADNDWVLPDPQRYVSAHHARIHYHAGRYILEDTSTNGVYLNDAQHPVDDGAHVLQNGDLIRLGEYELVAMLESGPADVDPAAAAPTATSSLIVDPAASSVEIVAVGQMPQDDLGMPLNLGDLLQPARSTANSPPSAKELSAALGDSETDRQAIARRIERLALAAARAQQRRTSAAAPVPVDANSGLAAFCKGAGIALDHFGPELQSGLLHLAGQLCREALVGLKDLERVRSENLRPMQIGVPVSAEDSRPSLARAAVADLLVEILGQHESRRLDAVQWLREVIDRAKAHDRATFAALRAAFVDFVARLEPAELESRFKRRARDGAGSGAHNWELYTEFFRSIAANADDPLPRVFLNAFSAAYEQYPPPSDKEPRPPREK